MAHRAEVNHNALYGPGPAMKIFQRNLNLADEDEDGRKKENTREKVRANREGVSNKERDSEKEEIGFLGLANVAAERFAHSKSTSNLVSRLG